jgi:hypothetical protein
VIARAAITASSAGSQVAGLVGSLAWSIAHLLPRTMSDGFQHDVKHAECQQTLPA